MRTVTLIPGDGIGPEVTQAAQRCVEATGVTLNWEIQPAGENALQTEGSLLPEKTLNSIRKNKVGLKGPMSTPIGKGFRSVNVEIRKRLDLFCCLRPSRYIGAVNSRNKNIDIVLMRENTEDLYAGIEFDLHDPFIESLRDAAEKKGIKGIIRSDSAISIKTISRFASERIIRFAFTYALNHKRKKVTCVHKANILKYTDGLFLKTFNEIAQEFSGTVNAENFIVDNMAMQLVLKPENFDVLVLPNLYGDIISDLCAGLIGGLGIAAGANIGDELAVFEPVHGSAPKYQGQNKVNPVATILSAALLLRHLNENEAAERIETAVQEVLTEATCVTYDLAPKDKIHLAASTTQMTDAIISRIKKH